MTAQYAFSYGSRAVWSTLESILVTANLLRSYDLLDRVNKNLTELNQYIEINMTSLAPTLNLETDTQLRLSEGDGAGFENQFLENFNETFADERSPCPFGH